MAVTINSRITFRPGSMFCFGTISSIADEKGILHRVADPPGRKPPPTNSENTGEALPSALRKKIATTTTPFYPDVLFIGRTESPPVSDDEPTAPGEEPPQRESRRRAQEADITKPENGIRSSLSRETRSRRWEKLRKNASSGNEGTPDDVIVDELRNKPSKTRGSAEKIHYSAVT
jgi:hypothetical protein